MGSSAGGTIYHSLYRFFSRFRVYIIIRYIRTVCYDTVFGAS